MYQITTDNQRSNNLKKKRTCRVKLKESDKKDKYLDLTRKFKKNVEDESNSDNNRNQGTFYSHLMIDKRFRSLGNKRTSGDHPHYNIILGSVL